MKNILKVLVVLVLSFFFISCDLFKKDNEEINISNIEVEQENVELTLGDEFTVNYTITPSNATNKDVTITSSNQNVVSVDGAKLNALGVGTSTITITANKGDATCSFVVNVKSNVIPEFNVKEKLQSIYSTYESSNEIKIKFTFTDSTKSSLANLSYKEASSGAYYELISYSNGTDYFYVDETGVKMNVNGIESTEDLDIYIEFDGVTTKQEFNFKAITEDDCKFLFDTSFFTNLNLCSFNNNEYKFTLDIRNYNGDNLNLVGVDEFNLYVKVDDNLNVLSFTIETKSAIREKNKSYCLEFLGLKYEK